MSMMMIMGPGLSIYLSEAGWGGKDKGLAVGFYLPATKRVRSYAKRVSFNSFFLASSTSVIQKGQHMSYQSTLSV